MLKIEFFINFPQENYNYIIEELQYWIPYGWVIEDFYFEKCFQRTSICLMFKTVSKNLIQNIKELTLEITNWLSWEVKNITLTSP